MSTEPKHDIEKTLKAYAQHRRQEIGAPGEMHPATRRLLQGEIARLRARKSSKQNFWFSLLGGSLPRAVLRVSISAGLLVVAGWLLLPSFLSKPKPNLFLAQSRPPQPEQAPLNEIAEHRKAGGITAKEKDQPEAIALMEPVQNLSKAPAVSQLDQAARTDLGLAGQPAVKKETIDAQSRYRFSSLERDKAIAGTPPQPKPAETAQAAVTGLGLVANLPTQKVSLGGGMDESKVAYQLKTTSVVSSLSVETSPSANSNNFAGAAALAFAKPTSMPPGDSLRGGVQANAQGGAASLGLGNMGTSSITQQFSQVNVATDRRKVANFQNSQGILNSFRVEQTGDQIRVVDNDGSVYLGLARMENETVKRTLLQAKQLSAQVGAGGTQTPPTQSITNRVNGTAPVVQNYSFRVSGTNLISNQQVVLTGNYTASASSPLVPSLQVAATNRQVRGISQTAVNGGAAGQAINSRIQGQAVIGGTNLIEIDALPVNP